ncbi:MAG TPA: hypothetical protein VGJ78_13610 [Vicinamibacterales bacterium]|jgi:hypothetical protein
MKSLSGSIVVALVMSMAGVPALAQTTSDALAWRTVAEKLEGGSAIDVRLRDGRHLKATFIAADEDGMALQRKTRVPVAIEQVPYDTIASLSRVGPSTLSGGKIAGIALGSAGAAIGTLFLILLATLD